MNRKKPLRYKGSDPSRTGDSFIVRFERFSIAILTRSLYLLTIIHVLLLISGIFWGRLSTYTTWWRILLTGSLWFFTARTLIRVAVSRFSPVTMRALLLDIIVIITVLGLRQSLWIYQLYLVGRMTLYFIQEEIPNRFRWLEYRRLLRNPAVWVILSFLFTILVGTLLLSLPWAVEKEYQKDASLLDHLFTATSATCVTGLIVRDTGTFYSHFGQGVILVLIQVGGLGLMTISTALALLLGQGMSTAGERLMSDLTGEGDRFEMLGLIRAILILTLVIEAVGAILLYLMLPEMEGRAYTAFFHSISAFCNAGFSTFSDSLMGFRSNWGVNITVMLLIILGGIGFAVLVDIRKGVASGFDFRRIRLHTKIVISVTALLILLGSVFYFVFEYEHTLRELPFAEKALAAVFQSVTTRTAGFNTVDNGQLSSPSVLGSILLMFIGASPGSTGGGIKTTAFAVLLLSVLSVIRGEERISLFQRTISFDIVRRVLALLALSIAFLFIMTSLLLMTETGRGSSFETLIFEAVSAFATVGLSMGITASLSVPGKFIIIILMFLGRIGPLTVIYALTKREWKKNIAYPQEKIEIG